MPTAPLDFNSTVLQELQNVRAGVAQLTTESEHILKGMARIEARMEKMENRDDTQQQSIESLRLDMHRIDATITATSGTALDSNRRAQLLERQYQGLSDSYMQLNRRVLGCEQETRETFQALQARIDAVDTALKATESRADAHRREWEPWAKALRWAALIIGGLVVAAVAIWLLRDVAQSIVNGGVP